MAEKISDEMALDHFKKKVLGEIPLEKQKTTFVVVGEKRYLVSEIVQHMEAKDEIGILELEVHKDFMRWLRRNKQ